MTKKGTEGMNKRVQKNVCKPALKDEVPEKTPTAGAIPLPKTTDAANDGDGKALWRSVFSSSGIRFARQVASLFGFDWPKLEERMHEWTDGCGYPCGGDGKPLRLWWDIPVLQVYVGFKYLKDIEVSDENCARCVELVKPYAVEYYNVPRGKEKIAGELYPITKDDDRFQPTSKEWDIFHDALNRLFLFMQSFNGKEPFSPELAELRDIRKSADDAATILLFLLNKKNRREAALASARIAARLALKRPDEERIARSRALDEVQRLVDTGKTDSSALEIVARNCPVPSQRARSGFLSKEGLKGAWKQYKANKRKREAEAKREADARTGAALRSTR